MPDSPGPALPGLIVFDWDDVFTLGSTAGYLACYHEAIVGVGVHLDADEEGRRIKSRWGQPHSEELDAALVERPELVPTAIEIYEKHLFGDTFVDHLSVVAGATDLIRTLTVRFPLAIVTGMHPKILRDRVFPRFGFSESAFGDVISSYDLEPWQVKPSPFAIEVLSEKHGVGTSDIWVVGDAENDMCMALSAGAVPIAVETGHLSRAEAIRIGVERILPDVTHLDTLIHKAGT